MWMNKLHTALPVYFEGILFMSSTLNFLCTYMFSKHAVMILTFQNVLHEPGKVLDTDIFLHDLCKFAFSTTVTTCQFSIARNSAKLSKNFPKACLKHSSLHPQ